MNLKDRHMQNIAQIKIKIQFEICVFECVELNDLQI